MNILKVQNLSKRFGKKDVLKNVSFEINEGDILAFIGQNGAGKTTTIKCLLGLQKINSGTILINGYDIKKDFVKAISNVGCIVESPDVYMYLTGYENLKLQANLYSNIKEKYIRQIISLVGLENKIDEKVSKYSLGMRQRLGLAIALINKPKLLILDEPTNGLDPEGIKDLRNLLLKLAESGMGILISSHNLSELESFCNKVCIMVNGSIIEENTIDNIRNSDNSKYIVKVNDVRRAAKFLKEKDRVLENEYLEVIKDEEEIARLIRTLVIYDVLVYEVKRKALTLEEVFINKAGCKKSG